MTRTRKGTKPPGWEIWSKRGFTGWLTSKLVKRWTHKRERQQGKTEAKDA